MKKILLGAILGAGLLLLIPWLMNQFSLELEIKGAQGHFIAWQLVNTFEGFLIGFMAHWIHRAIRDRRKHQSDHAP